MESTGQFLNHFLPVLTEPFDFSLYVAVYCLCWLLSNFGAGHFFSRTGRKCYAVVLQKYMAFFCVSLGIWSNELLENYDTYTIGERFKLKRGHTELELKYKSVKELKELLKNYNVTTDKEIVDRPELIDKVVDKFREEERLGLESKSVKELLEMLPKDKASTDPIEAHELRKLVLEAKCDKKRQSLSNKNVRDIKNILVKKNVGIENMLIEKDEIDKEIDKMVMNNKLYIVPGIDDAVLLRSIVCPRASMCQIIPVFTPVAILAHFTADSPIFVFSDQLRNGLNKLYYTFETAKAKAKKDAEEQKDTHLLDDQKWLINTRAILTFANSRFMCAIICFATRYSTARYLTTTTVYA